MNNSSIHDICFDVIALETKHQQDYRRSRSIREFSENYQDNLRDTFAGGQWDGYLDMMPESYQWHTPCYRSGYLSGITQKWDGGVAILPKQVRSSAPHEQFSQLR